MIRAGTTRTVHEFICTVKPRVDPARFMQQISQNTFYNLYLQLVL